MNFRDQSGFLIPIFVLSMYFCAVEGGITAKTGNDSIKMFKTYKVTTILEEPYMYETVQGNTTKVEGNNRYAGMIKDMLERMAQMGEFYYELSVVKDGKYGSRDPKTEKWNGMIGEVQRGESDFAAAPLVITHEREGAVRFTLPFQSTGPVILMKKPAEEPVNPADRVFRLLKPLSWGVWLLIFICFLLTAITLYVIGRFHPKEWKELHAQGKATDKEAESLTVSNSFWFALSTLLLQGNSLSPRTLSGRIVTAFWWLFVMLSVIAYASSLTKNLLSPFYGTTQFMELPVASADDLSKQTHIKYGVVKDGAVEAFFRDSQMVTYNRMWNFMSSVRPSVFVSSTEEGLNKIRKANGQYAFILESSMAKYAAGRSACDLVVVGEPMAQRSHAFAVQKQDPILHVLNDAILRLKANGELLKIERKWFTRGNCIPSKRPQESFTVFESLNVTDFSGAIILLLIGIITGLVCLFIEIIIHRRRAKKNATSDEEK